MAVSSHMIIYMYKWMFNCTCKTFNIENNFPGSFIMDGHETIAATVCPHVRQKLSQFHNGHYATKHKTHYSCVCMYMHSCLRLVTSRLMMSCAFHGDIIYQTLSQILFLSRRGWPMRLCTLFGYKLSNKGTDQIENYVKWKKMSDSWEGFTSPNP